MRTISQIADDVRTQDNRITSDPIFVVQQKRRDYGYDADHSDTWAWCDDDYSSIREDNDPKAWAYLNALDRGEITPPDPAELNDDAEPPHSLDDFHKVYYRERWEFVTACFTEKGAQDYIELNGHNLTEPRIYVESGWRNQEWQVLRKLLLGWSAGSPAVAEAAP